MRMELVTGPQAVPVPLTGPDGVRRFLRVNVDTFDEEILELTCAAVRAVEDETGRALMTQTWKMWLDGFPRSSSTPIRIFKVPVQSITAITYTDENGDAQTWDAAKYSLDNASAHLAARITPAYAESYPATQAIPNSVAIEFVAGAATPAEVPAIAKLLVKKAVAEMWHLRMPEHEIMEEGRRLQRFGGPTSWRRLARRIEVVC